MGATGKIRIESLRSEELNLKFLFSIKVNAQYWLSTFCCLLILSRIESVEVLI